MREIGPKVSGNSCTLTVWAPLRKTMDVHFLEPVDRLVPMSRDELGYWTARVDGIGHGALYRYRLDGSLERPDPASPAQPQGVHGASMVLDHSRFKWVDLQPRIDLNDYIVYEIHIGTFTGEGTFASAAARLSELDELGVNAVEIMPVAQFPGNRNWGYDGVYPFAVQNSYGGADGLKALVAEAHRQNMAAILDVVYNHLGPEGNYLRDFGPYFTNRYKTPWGESLNFDGPYSDGACDFFIENALYLFRQFHFDALRVDAVHAISDMGARPFLQRLAEAVDDESARSGSKKYLIAESDLNDSRVIRDRAEGGFGMNAQWSDDFHHSLHTLLTGESRGYYADFGTIEHLVRTLKKGFYYSGDYSVARKRTHGNDASGFHTGRFVVGSQNHDQVGNRMLGERLISLSDFERAKLAASAVMLSPYIPLLFMGEEYGEDNPFLYFADHTDESLKQAVRAGRKAEFAEFHEAGEPPDPFALQTFMKSKLDWEKRKQEPHSTMLRFYRELIRVRKSCPAIAPCSRDRLEVIRHDNTPAVSIHYLHEAEPAVCCFNFGRSAVKVSLTAEGKWEKVFDSRAVEWSEKAAPAPGRIESRSQEFTLEPYQSAVYVRRTN